MNVVEANGAKIPAIGLGTMTLKGAVCVGAVKTALRLGYRHIDTAERYGNETEVGEGLRQGIPAAGLKREDVFVTTKVYQDKLAAPERSAGGDARCALQGEARRQGQARRRRQLHDRVARRGGEACERAAGDQP